MGVYNPWADMPRSCVACDFRYSCPLSSPTAHGIFGFKHKDCPLVEVEVKATHGRLIDENAVMREFAQRDNFSEKTLMDFLMEAPTIIEAEGKDDG